MDNPFAQKLRFFPINDLEDEAALCKAPHAHEIIYSSTDLSTIRPSGHTYGMPAFVTRRHEMQIISCRNIQTNVRLSLMMAIRMAYASPVRNTGYVGSGFVWDVDPRLLPDGTRIMNHAKNATPGKPFQNSEEVRVLYVNGYASVDSLDRYVGALHTSGLVKVREDMPMGIIHAPIGTWPEKLEEIRKLIMDNKFTVLVLNAFEFLTLTQREKTQLSIDLIRLQEELQVTVIIFTQEVRKDMQAGILGRGPIGRLQVLADSVIKIEDDTELFDGDEQNWESWQPTHAPEPTPKPEAAIGASDGSDEQHATDQLQATDQQRPSENNEQSLNTTEEVGEIGAEMEMALVEAAEGEVVQEASEAGFAG